MAKNLTGDTLPVIGAWEILVPRFHVSSCDHSISPLHQRRQFHLCRFWCAAISRKVSEWRERKEAILRGEAPPSEFVQTEAEDIYKVERTEVSPA